MQTTARLSATRKESVSCRGLVNARGVAATRMAAGENMRLTTAISSPHRLVPESHHLTRNCFFPSSLLLKLRTPTNLNRAGGLPGCLEANLATNLNRPEADHEDRDPSPETPQRPRIWLCLVCRQSRSSWGLGRSEVFLKQPQILRPHRYAQGSQDDSAWEVGCAPQDDNAWEKASVIPNGVRDLRLFLVTFHFTISAYDQ